MLRLANRDVQTRTFVSNDASRQQSTLTAASCKAWEHFEFHPPHEHANLEDNFHTTTYVRVYIHPKTEYVDEMHFNCCDDVKDRSRSIIPVSYWVWHQWDDEYYTRVLCEDLVLILDSSSSAGTIVIQAQYPLDTRRPVLDVDEMLQILYSKVKEYFAQKKSQ
jgi:hypothetical protein